MKTYNNKEELLEAVKQNGLALKYASKDLQKDKEVVLAAVKQDGYVLYYASEELNNDKEVVLEAVKKKGGALKYAPESLKNDKEIVLTAVKQEGMLLYYTSDELKNNTEFSHISDIFACAGQYERKKMESDVFKKQIEEIAKKYNIQNPITDPMLKYLTESTNFRYISALVETGKFDYQTIDAKVSEKQSFGKKLQDPRNKPSSKDSYIGFNFR